MFEGLPGARKPLPAGGGPWHDTNPWALSGVKEFLKNLASQGELDSSGRFTLDLSRARQKLGGFRLARTDRYLVALLLAALQMQARRFYLKAGFGSLLIDWDGVPLDDEVRTTQRLWGSGQPGVATLLLGLQTALVQSVLRAQWASAPNHLWTFTRGQEQWRERAFRGPLQHRLKLLLNQGVVDRIWHKFHSVATPAETRWAEEAALAGKYADIRWNDQPLSREILVTHTRSFVFPGASEELQLPVRFQKPPIATPELEEAAGFGYFSAGSRRSTTVFWHLFGLALGEQKLRGFLPGLALYLNSHTLEPDLSLSKLVHSEARQRVVLRILSQLVEQLEKHPGWPTPSHFYYRSSAPLPAELHTLFITRLLPLLARKWPPEAEEVVRLQLLRHLEHSCLGMDCWEDFPLFSSWTEEGRLKFASASEIRRQGRPWGRVLVRHHRFRDQDPLPHPDMSPIVRLDPEHCEAVQQWLGLPVHSCPDGEDPCWHRLQKEEGFLQVIWRRGSSFVSGVPAAQRGDDGKWHPCPPHYPEGLRVRESSSAEDILGLFAELWQGGEGPHLAGRTLSYLALLAEQGGRYPDSLPPEPLRNWGFAALEEELLHRGAILDVPGRFEPWQRGALQRYFGTQHVVAPDGDDGEEPVLEIGLTWRRTQCTLTIPADLLALDHELSGEMRLGLKQQPYPLRVNLGFGPLQFEGESLDLRPADLHKGTPLLQQWLQQVRQCLSARLLEISEQLYELPAREREPLQRALWSLLAYQMVEEPDWQHLPLSQRLLFQDGDGNWRDLRYVNHLLVNGQLRLWIQQPVAPGPRDNCWLVPPLRQFLAERILQRLEEQARKVRREAENSPTKGGAG